MIDLAPRALWRRPVIIGGGVAGAVAALSLSPRPVILVDAMAQGVGAASQWAQGGLAAAVGSDDSADIHAADTVAAGAGLTDPEIARRIAGAGPRAVAALEEFGVRFDRDPSGEFALGLEAAHSRRRILHVRDRTGHAILSALLARVGQTDSVTPWFGTATRLVLENGRVIGVVLRGPRGAVLLPTGAIVLATGGVGGLWRSTTNPANARGAGIVLAGMAGAALADLEFAQFHPTALAVGADPMPLVSEAVRGEGAWLINAKGDRFMAGTEGGELAPRDVVARAVFAEWSRGGSAALDTRHWPEEKFAARFPTIYNVLSNYGLDPARDPIPIRPAAHYHMGGVQVGPTGRATVEGLWACGEVACTGLHGANRLASNSLLEAVVCARFVAEDVAGAPAGETAPPTQAAFGEHRPAPSAIGEMRDLMDRHVGVVRDGAGLSEAISRLETLRADGADTEAEGPLSVALAIARAALARTESRGAHFRSDAGPPEEPPRHSQTEWKGPLTRFEV